jgi:hypothetical protein
MPCPRLVGVTLALAACVVAWAATGAPAAGKPLPPRVTLITDSVGGVLYWDAEARDDLAAGLDLQLETRTCRRLVVIGCPAYGQIPPSALATVQALGTELGPVVVVDVGYNDRPAGYADGLDAVMRALVEARVRYVIWVTLEETETQWVSINPQIRAAVARWPQLVVADWAPVAAAHPSWFVDRAHMNADGGLGFAKFLRPIIFWTCGETCIRRGSPRRFPEAARRR